MTPDTARVTAWVEETRARLAEALAKEYGQLPSSAQSSADRLLPVVQALCAERAAEELRAAALEWQRLTDGSGPVARFLRARASSLTDGTSR